MPPGAREDFDLLFAEWQMARNVLDALERVEDQHGWMVYKYIRPAVVEPEEHWEQAFHGTWWYSVWSVLESGVFLESDDRGKGHDFWEPGVYCTPVRSTARWYARPHNVFGDGVFHRVIYELRVDPERRKRNRQRGGVQWVFPTEAVSLYAVWVQVNSPPAVGEERVNEWEPELEALPPGAVAPPPPTVNPRDLAVEGWPDIEDEKWNDGEEDLAPYLAGASWSSGSWTPKSGDSKAKGGGTPADAASKETGELATPRLKTGQSYSRLRLGATKPPGTADSAPPAAAPRPGPTLVRPRVVAPRPTPLSGAQPKADGSETATPSSAPWLLAKYAAEAEGWGPDGVGGGAGDSDWQAGANGWAALPQRKRKRGSGGASADSGEGWW